MNKSLEIKISELMLLDFTNSKELVSKIEKIKDILVKESKEKAINDLDELQNNKKNILDVNEFNKLIGCIILIKLSLFIHYDGNDQNKFIEDCLKEYYKAKNNNY